MSTLEWWRGEQGDEYTDRNDRAGDPVPALRSILNDHWREIDRVLEVGCNLGRNLEAFPSKYRVGVEPNGYARMKASRKFNVVDGHAGALPFADGSFDLVFTAGVLIHVGPDDLNRALYEIHRVSRRFILAVEYRGNEAVEYRGHEEGIWKRPYGAEYMNRFKKLTVIGHGDEFTLDGTPFDGCSWWMFDKRP